MCVVNQWICLLIPSKTIKQTRIDLLKSPVLFGLNEMIHIIFINYLKTIFGVDKPNKVLDVDKLVSCGYNTVVRWWNQFTFTVYIIIIVLTTVNPKTIECLKINKNMHKKKMR